MQVFILFLKINLIIIFLLGLLGVAITQALKILGLISFTIKIMADTVIYINFMFFSYNLIIGNSNECCRENY